MARTSVSLVQGILGSDYGPRADGTLPDLTPYIAAANSIVNRVATCASAKGLALSSAELELVERWMAADAYTKSDPVYTSKSTGGQSASFVRGKDEPEPYRSIAVSLDYSGCLNAILKRQFAFGWSINKCDQGQSGIA